MRGEDTEIDDMKTIPIITVIRKRRKVLMNGIGTMIGNITVCARTRKKKGVEGREIHEIIIEEITTMEAGTATIMKMNKDLGHPADQTPYMNPTGPETKIRIVIEEIEIEKEKNIDREEILGMHIIIKVILMIRLTRTTNNISTMKI
uniref:Uncharacterized protein LOC114340932 n=1 Tax=Diabrotica virgifera virgifera TaxID=50390 RepID=A0A6P7GQK1_DIAVI